MKIKCSTILLLACFVFKSQLIVFFLKLNIATYLRMKWYLPIEFLVFLSLQHKKEKNISIESIKHQDISVVQSLKNTVIIQKNLMIVSLSVTRDILTERSGLLCF